MPIITSLSNLHFLSLIKKIKYLWIVTLFFIFSIAIKGQEKKDTVLFQPPIPVELMVGNESLLYKMVVTKQVSSNFKFYNLLTYESSFITSSASGIFNQTAIFYDFSKHFSIGSGANFSSFHGVSPILVALYSNFNTTRGIVIQPSITLEKNNAKELFGMYELTYKVSPTITGYFRLDAFTSWYSKHDFSYLNWRLGTQTKQGRFGPAINFQFVANIPTPYINYGAFYNILLKY